MFSRSLAPAGLAPKAQAPGRALARRSRSGTGAVFPDQQGRIAGLDERAADLGVARPDGIEVDRGLARSSLLAFLLYMVGAGLAYVTQLVIARIVGPASFGIYSYVLAWVTLLAYGCTLGFNVSLMRFVPAYQAVLDWRRARGVIRYAYRWGLAAALVAAAAGTTIVLAWSSPTGSELVTTFVLGLWSVPLITLLLISMATVRALGGVATALAPERVLRDSLILALVGLAAWSGIRAPDATMVMAAMLVSTATALGLISISVRKLLPPPLMGVAPLYSPEDWRPTILPLTVMVAAEILVSRAGVMLLGMNGKVQDAGLFALAINLAALVTLPRVAVSTLFSPRISSLHALGDVAGMQRLFARATALTFAGALALSVPLLLTTELLLGWLGPDFVEGADVVRILVLGQLVSAIAGPQQSVMTMTGCERAGAALLSASAATNLVACIVAVQFGSVAVALATAGALIAWNVGMGLYIYRKFRVRPGLLQLSVQGGNATLPRA